MSITTAFRELLGGNGSEKRDPLPDRPKLPDENDAESFEQRVTLCLAWGIYAAVSMASGVGAWIRAAVRIAFYLGLASAGGGGAIYFGS